MLYQIPSEWQLEETLTKSSAVINSTDMVHCTEIIANKSRGKKRREEKRTHLVKEKLNLVMIARP